MRTRLVAGVAALATAALLAGCSGSPSPTSATAATGPARSGAQASGSAISVATLARHLDAALNQLTSAHLDVDAGGLGGTSTADVALSAGHATASDVHLTEQGHRVEEITVGGTSYVKVPGPAGGKPWVPVSPTSGNPIAKALATGISVAGLTSSLGIVTDLVRSSSELAVAGREPVGGVAATHYTMKLNPKQATGSPQLTGLLAVLGSSPVPVDLWLDAQDRPVKFTIHVSLGGVALPVTVRVSKFDAPVAIAAPPAGQIATD
jgi:hypothetical protein